MTGFDVLYALPYGTYFESVPIHTSPELFLHDSLRALVQTVRVQIVNCPTPGPALKYRTASILQVEFTTKRFWRCQIWLDEPRDPHGGKMAATVLRYDTYGLNYTAEPDEIVAVLLDSNYPAPGESTHK